jgi:hypothetical protein
MICNHHQPTLPILPITDHYPSHLLQILEVDVDYPMTLTAEFMLYCLRPYPLVLRPASRNEASMVYPTARVWLTNGCLQAEKIEPIRIRLTFEYTFLQAMFFICYV